MIHHDQELEHKRIISSDHSPVFEIERVADARAEPSVRGERFLNFLDAIFVRLNSYVRRTIPVQLNPFVQLGAVSNTTFAVALVTGILLLFWYSPSVNKAYDSMLAIENSPFLAAWIRSLHRYSSDACMLFALLHGIQVLFARKVGGARWVAWVTGIVLVGILWLAGWTGYWLVWDERAQQIAIGTAQLIDALPLFQDPFSRSFLTDTSVNSLFFFIIFFLHMLLPLAFGVALWMHLMRLNKTTFITNKVLSIVIVISLFGLSILLPASVAEQAKMQTVPDGFTIDWFYLLPLFFTDRLQGGLLWLLALTGTIIVTGMPWWISKKRPQPAVVHEESCNGCAQCYIDCPFNAISMLQRPEEHGKSPTFARVDPMKCVGCGICVGSCDSSGIDQARLPVLDVRRWVNQHASDKQSNTGRFIAFICAESAGAAFRLDPDGNCDDLPGYQVVPVPCAGWIHMLTVERASRRGAKGILIAGCDTNAACRKGSTWTEERLDGTREPIFRLHDDPAREQVRFVRFDRTDRSAFLKTAAAFREGQPVPGDGYGRSFKQLLTALLLLLILGSVVGWLSDAYYRLPAVPHGELIVSFKHAGQTVKSDQVNESNDEDRLSHMRSASSGRAVRLPVRLKVLIDGVEQLNLSYEAGGLFNDGNSVAIESFDVSPGVHEIKIYIDDSEDLGTWSYTDSASLNFKASERRVVQFELPAKFSWH